MTHDPVVFALGGLLAGLVVTWAFARRTTLGALARARELQNALAASEAHGAERERRAADRSREAEAAISGAIERSVHDLDQVRLPLHILLENPFGELNDNQVELVGEARDAAEHAAARLRRTRDLLAIQPVQLRREPVRIGDVVTSLVATLQSRASSRRVRVSADIAAPLPAVRGDRIRLQEALAVIGSACLDATPDAATLHLTARADDAELVMGFDGARIEMTNIDVAWAARMLAAHDGSLRVTDERVELRLPR